MTTIVQVEFRESLLSIRDEILQSLGHPVISALGSRAARKLDLSHESVGVVLIGHGAPWEERCNLATYFRETLPGVPIVVSLRRRDKDVNGADYNCPADNPPLWVRTVSQALAGIGYRHLEQRIAYRAIELCDHFLAGCGKTQFAACWRCETISLIRSSHRQRTRCPSRCTPPIQRSIPFSVMWSAFPPSTLRPVSVTPILEPLN